jgi:HEPN domain-containing protein
MKNKTAGWVFFANQDMVAAKALIEYVESTGAEITGEIAFLCQQAIEKFLKGYLVEHGKEPRKIHDLLALYSEVKSISDWNLDEKLLEKISDLYTVIRYPRNISLITDGRLPTMENARSYWELAKKVEGIFTELVGSAYEQN